MILVIGATGILGGEICRRLRGANRPVRALVRPTANAERLEELRSIGVELVSGDLKDRASLDRACAGADTVITTASTTLSRQPDDSIGRTDRDGHIALVDAARAAGVGHFIYTSFSGNFELECALRDAKRAVERHLQASGMTYTILRPSVFMEVWLSPHLGFDYHNARAQIFGGGDRPISYISLGDVAQFAVDAVDNPAARNAILELGGPEALSPHDVVRIFEEQGGRPFEVQHVPEDALVAKRAATADPMEHTFTTLMLGCARGDAIDMRPTLARFPIRLTSVSEYARRSLGR